MEKNPAAKITVIRLGSFDRPSQLKFATSSMILSRALDFGAIRFVPVEDFGGPVRSLNRVFSMDQSSEAWSLNSINAQNVDTWPRAHTAYCQGGVFVVETSTPDFTATLRFFPERPHMGGYEIRDLLSGGVENGRTITVRVVPPAETDCLTSMLAPFPTRYAVVTASANSPHRRLMWLVGLKAFQSLDEEGYIERKPARHTMSLGRRLLNFSRSSR